MQGRNDEAVRLIEPSWDHLAATGQEASAAAVSLLRLHIDLKRNRIPADAIRAFLDEAATAAPEDDRVWLGRANLAIRTGSYGEAARLLHACLRCRPDDAPVWRARLNWAMGTGRVAEAREAMEHLPSGETAPAQVQKIAAWFAAQRGDHQAERRALDRLIQADPADFSALDRLTSLATQDGQADRAVEVRKIKTEFSALQARYFKLYARHQAKRDAAEMASLAERLGRLFEARAFLAIAVAVDPDRGDLRRNLRRLNHEATTARAPGPTLAAFLAPEVDPQLGSSRPRASP
jgi:tetratricopeptide (TPR) repeat protein